MRMFLPIKGPGGRYLTPREKVALLILGLTLVLCALTLLAGDGAYAEDGNRNPVSGFVAFLCRTFGGGIIALYALVLVWSGLIYFKGERVVDMRPLAGRAFAALCVTLGISGVLGIAHLETAGSLGLTVGAAIGNTFGATLGFPILIVLMLLGVHLAGQGAWSAMREPVRATATTGTAHGGLGFGLKDAPQGRFAHTPLPDDGDPTADERTLAITQAMEEIERSKGVTIVDVEPETEIDDRPSIGEEVDAVPESEHDTEEADVRRGLAAVEEVLADSAAAEVEEEEEVEEDVDEEAHADDEEEAEESEADPEYASERHGFVPVPPERAVVPEDDECVEAVFMGDHDEEEEEYADDEEEEEYEDDTPAFAAAEHEEDDEDETALLDDEEEDDAESDEEYEVDDEEAYVDEDDEYDDEEYEDEVDEDDEQAAYDEEDEDEEEAEDEEEYEDDDVDEVLEAATRETGDEESIEPEDEESYESVVAGQADGAGDEEDEDEDDPYAQGGLLRRLRHGAGAGEAREDEDRPYTAFDWRGRPLE